MYDARSAAFMPFYKRSVAVEPSTLAADSAPVDAHDTDDDILLTSYASRITKKTFGMYVEPHNSPVKPERFRGYHTGIDLEVTSEEINVDMPVCAMCNGDVVVARWMSGYGGVLVQRCDLPVHGPVTVVYGHLRPGDDLEALRNHAIVKGQRIGVLGAAYSAETDGERKHLHLAIHKGTGITYAGYVDPQEKLSEWIDPCSVITCAQ